MLLLPDRPLPADVLYPSYSIILCINIFHKLFWFHFIISQQINLPQYTTIFPRNDSIGKVSPQTPANTLWKYRCNIGCTWKRDFLDNIDTVIIIVSGKIVPIILAIDNSLSLIQSHKVLSMKNREPVSNADSRFFICYSNSACSLLLLTIFV